MAVMPRRIKSSKGASSGDGTIPSTSVRFARHRQTRGGANEADVKMYRSSRKSTRLLMPRMFEDIAVRWGFPGVLDHHMSDSMMCWATSHARVRLEWMRSLMNGRHGRDLEDIVRAIILRTALARSRASSSDSMETSTLDA